MSRLILFNKPYGVICQFTPEGGHASLKDYIPLPDFYPAGRLDMDSEGLVLLTDDGQLQARISHPKYKMPKTYWAQVEGTPDERALKKLRDGVILKDFTTQPALVDVIKEPDNLWLRVPPIRFRKHVATTWLALTISEGKNRQVRRMTAAVLLPTLRLIRYAIGQYTVQGIAPGEWKLLNRHSL